MTDEHSESDDDRSENKRIGELEDQVKELSGLVEILLSKRESDLSPSEKEELDAAADTETEVDEGHKHHLVGEALYLCQVDDDPVRSTKRE